jgi:hypothetical protein
VTDEERMVSMGVARTLNEARELVTAAGRVGMDPVDLAEKIQGVRILPDLDIIRAQLDQAAVDVRHARRLARRGPWVPPRGAARRSRQVRSKRARAARRVAAREGRPCVSLLPNQK